jgi:hypothetical protein
MYWMSALVAGGSLLAGPMAAAKTVRLFKSPGSGDNLGGLGARHQDGPGLHLIGNAEPVQDLRKIDAARDALGRIGIDDRFGGEEGAF